MAVKPTIKIPTAKVAGSANEVLLNERLRINSIVSSPEGIARPELARKLALESNIDAQSAVELMKTVPVSNPYVAAMDALGPVNIESFATVSPTTPEDKRAKRLTELRRNIKPEKGV